MTTGNRMRVQQLADHFKTLSEENPDAETGVFALLRAQQMILTILLDLNFRPEANK